MVSCDDKNDFTPVETIVLGGNEIGGQFIQDESTAEDIISTFYKYGGREIDTAFIYGLGRSERLLGKTANIKMEHVSTKVTSAFIWEFTPESIREQFSCSLKRLGTDSVDIFYLHAPSVKTDIKITLEVVNELYMEGKFRRFGISNYISWQVSEIQVICRREGWICPTVYQGLFNALCRGVVTELMPCLRRYNMSFYAYNPLAGGFLTGKYTRGCEPSSIGRFGYKRWGARYRKMFWNEANFKAMDNITAECNRFSISPTSAAIRWLKHHSPLNGCYGDGIIIGGKRCDQIAENMKAFQEGPLPSDLVNVIEESYLLTKPFEFKYYINITPDTDAGMFYEQVNLTEEQVQKYQNELKGLSSELV